MQMRINIWITIGKKLKEKTKLIITHKLILQKKKKKKKGPTNQSTKRKKNIHINIKIITTIFKQIKIQNQYFASNIVQSWIPHTKKM